MDGGTDIPQRHPVNVGQSEDRCHRRSFSLFRFDPETAARPFRRLLEKRHAKPDSPGRSCGIEGIRHLTFLFLSHPASVIRYDHGERVILRLHGYGDPDQVRSGTHGILSYIQDVQGYLRHHRLFVFGQDVIDIVHGQTSVNFIVDHHDRREAARAHTAAGIQ